MSQEIIVPVKSIADFKRKMKPGVRVYSVYHMASGGYDNKGVYQYKDESKGIRTCSKSQTNSFALATFIPDQMTANDSWFHWPKGKEVHFNADGSVTIFVEDSRSGIKPYPIVPCITYAILENN